MSRIFPRSGSILTSAVLLCLFSTTGVGAQSVEGRRGSDWEFNLHAAALRPGLFEESAGAFQFGGRLVRNFGNGLSFGGSVDWARPGDVTLANQAGLSASLLLYSAELDYRFRASSRTEIFLGTGIGAANLTLDQAPFGVAESSTGLLIPVGGGIKVLNRAVAPSWAIRFDVRDNVILLETLNVGGDTATEPRNNLEASVGVSFLFGGGGAEEELAADRDSDRDGVPDPGDFCLNRPGARVDTRGCPLEPEPTPELEPEITPGITPELEPEPVAEPDSDLDGVPDSRDGCLGTPSGIAVRDDGCPAPPPAGAAVEAPPGDGDGDGVGDDLDACPGTPAGLAIDERGCLARPAPREEAPEPEKPRSTACLDPSAGERVIEFDGRRFLPAGFPQPVERAFLVNAGEFEGLPIYVSDTAKKPYPDFWVPRCGAENLFELYVEVGSVP